MLKVDHVDEERMAHKIAESATTSLPFVHCYLRVIAVRMMIVSSYIYMLLSHYMYRISEFLFFFIFMS